MCIGNVAGNNTEIVPYSTQNNSSCYAPCFKGSMDDIIIWNRGLSDVEVGRLYQAMVPKIPEISNILNT